MDIEDDGQGFDLEAAARREGRRPWGLMGIRERAEILGGTARIESAPGKGTHVEVRIPIPRESARRATRPGDARRNARREGRMTVPKIRVVIVDDHAILREGVRALLQLHADIEVVGEAGDGKDALGVVERMDPDVVLMDIAMPGLGGIEASLELRRWEVGRRS